MTGDLSFDGSSLALRAHSGGRLRYTAADPSGNQRTFVDIKNNDHSDNKDSGYYLKLYHLQEPTDAGYPTTKNMRYYTQDLALLRRCQGSPQHAATKNYVDTTVYSEEIADGLVGLQCQTRQQSST